MANRKRQANHSPANKTGKKTKEKSKTVCAVCDEVILEAEDQNEGHDAVYCEGECQSWLHRKCAGLTHKAFVKICESNDPYHCVYCRVLTQSKEILYLKEQIKILTNKLGEQSSHSPESSTHTDVEPSSNQAHDKPNNAISKNQTVNPPKAPQMVSDKRFNVVVYGIEESPPNTSKETRQNQDLENLLSVLSNIDPSLNSSCIQDFFRLGKFSTSNSRPRPLLVKFLRIFEANLVLSKRTSVESVVIKPDLPFEERAINAAFLKERWNLTQKGTERKHIKRKQNVIYVNKILYGKIIKSSDGSYKVTHVGVDHDPPTTSASVATDDQLTPTVASEMEQSG